MREMADDTKHTKIKGNALFVSAVISRTITNDVSGACTTAAKYAAIINMKTVVRGTSGMIQLTDWPRAAPTESEGENSPPGMPLIDEKRVAANFPNPYHHGNPTPVSKARRVA